MDRSEIVSAGAVVSRGSRQVLLVHRPRYDDWSFPKGKLDPGEHPLTAAVREVEEETGLVVRLGRPLSPQRYEIRNGHRRTKHVQYWTGSVVGAEDVSRYTFKDEIDAVAWVDAHEAGERLTYRRDRETLAEMLALSEDRTGTAGTTPLVVLRHAKARARDSWAGDDRERPLTAEGEAQAVGLVPLLGAYGVRRVVTSGSRRCRDTVAPYVRSDRTRDDVDSEVRDALSEHDARARTVARVVRALTRDATPTALCTHRKVLPLVLDALGVPERTLHKGEMLVVHHRGLEVDAVELHLP